MKKAVWRKHHKWLGLVLGFFIIMFSLSGLVLNHPSLFAKINISRSVLPSDYQYNHWNRGLLRGTTRWQGHVLAYGNSGIWLTDSAASSFTDFNKGLPDGADFRQIRGMTVAPSGMLFALGQYGLYRLQAGNSWYEVALPHQEEKLSDIAILGDSLVITGRSHVYLSIPPYKNFEKLTLPQAEGDDGKVSLFRTIWLLHSGELFGTIGILVVDAIAFILIFLTLTGIIYWLVPHNGNGRGRRLIRRFIAWHDQAGRLTIVLTLFLCITGWLLRPPALLAIATGKIPPLPFTTMDSNNPWHDKLRTLRYDITVGDWLLYSSEGFYSLQNLYTRPKPMSIQPPVSVMGVNVEEKDKGGRWLIGSFSGMYKWDRQNRIVTDYYTGLPARQITGKPIGTHATSGYSSDFDTADIVIDYHRGTNAFPMPQWMASLPMSLRNVCIEIHTGRIYTFLGTGSIFYIFLIGIAVFWCIWTGWKIRHRKRSSIGNRFSKSS